MPGVRGMRIEGSTIHLGQGTRELGGAVFEVHLFRDLALGRTAMALGCGDLRCSEPLLSRVHSACLTSECLMGRDCDCAEQLKGALTAIARSGRGVLFYLMQEGRGAGLTAKARDRMLVQASGNRLDTFGAYAQMGLPADLRRYDEIGPMCRLLGVESPVWLLTNNPEKARAVASVLADEKIEVRGTRPIQGPTSPFNRDYLSAKHHSGHSLDSPRMMPPAMPPSAVRIFDPVALPGDSDRLVTASYFLPISLEEPFVREGGGGPVEWFRASIVFDRRTTRESVVLSLAEARTEEDGDEGRVTMSLFDRLPGRPASGRRRLCRALQRIRARGRGAVSVDFDDHVGG